MRLKGKVALLCGVGTRMGRASAVLLAQEGAKAVIVARRKETLAETQRQIEDAGGEAIILPADTSSAEAAQSVVDETMKRYGRIDVLYDAVGGFWEPTRKFENVDPAFWNGALANTLNSAYNLTRAVRPIMAKQGSGSIVFVGASFSVRQAGNAAYSAAKMGLIGYAQQLSRELWSDNIRVNLVASGLVRSALAPGKVSAPTPKLARVGAPEDIAHAVLFFASDDSAWVTGQVLSVDGGVDSGGRSIGQFGEMPPPAQRP